MPSAEVLTIGTELLLGEILDSNAQYLARQLRDAGIDHFWTTTVGDNEGRIAEAVRIALSRSDIVLSTGGLGPTVDDVTREGVAAALDLNLEFKEDLWEEIQRRFARFGRTPSENNRRQAYLPAGARALDNPVGSAPGFIVEKAGKLIIAMPGVPREMIAITESHVLPYFAERYGRAFVIRSRILHTAGVPESEIDTRIADLERQTNPTVGLAAHTGQVDVRLTAKAASEKEAEQMLDKLEAEVRSRLEDWVFGVDGEKLADSILAQLESRDWKLAIAASGFGDALSTALQGHLGSRLELKSHALAPKVEELPDFAMQAAEDAGADVGVAAWVDSGGKPAQLHLAVHLPTGAKQYDFPYGGVAEAAPAWAASTSLSLLRRLLARESDAVAGG